MSNPFQVIADRLGLTYETRSGLVPLSAAHGLLDGQPVRCSWSDRGTRVEGLVDPPLDLGLRVTTKNITVSLGFGAAVVVGDPSWDAEVATTADEPARAVHLLTPDVRSAVLRLNAETMGFELSDDKAFAAALQYDVEASVRALQVMARLGRAVKEARAAVPPPARIVGHVAACSAVAAEHRLSVEHTPFRMTGALREVSLSVAFRRTGAGQFAIDLRAAPVAPPQTFGLVVKPETTLDRVRTFFGGQDLQTGDAAFDPAFLVRAAEEGRALGALDGDVRALLLDLRARFEKVSLQDATLTLAGPATGVRGDEMGHVIEMACTVVERVERASAAVARGPYR